MNMTYPKSNSENRIEVNSRRESAVSTSAVPARDFLPELGVWGINVMEGRNSLHMETRHTVASQSNATAVCHEIEVGNGNCHGRRRALYKRDGKLNVTGGQPSDYRSCGACVRR